MREALNILAAEGFVLKIPGRRARVTKLSREDVRQIYSLRSYVEGLAARLIVENHVDPGGMHEAWRDMQRAAATGDIESLVNADLEVWRPEREVVDR